MGLFVVILLAGLWASILLPGHYRARRDVPRLNSTHAFERTMTMLARRCGSHSQQTETRPPPGRHVLILDDAASVAGRPTSRSIMRRRQRAALAQLGTVVTIAGTLAVLIGGLLWVVFGTSVVAFVGYALLVAQVRAREAERGEKVHNLRPLRRPILGKRRGSPGADDTAGSRNVRIQRRVG